MEISLGSPGVAAVLALVYAFGTWLGGHGAEGVWARRRWVSVAAGVSVAYVFVDVLPELGAQHQTFRKAAGEGLLFAEQRINARALLAFVALYGLEHMVLASRERRRERAAAGAADPVYWLHLGGFAVYSALIGYLLVERAERGPLALAVYGLGDGPPLPDRRSLAPEGARPGLRSRRTLGARGERGRAMGGGSDDAALRGGVRPALRRPGRGRRDHEPQGRDAPRTGRAVLAVLSGRGGLRRAPVPHVRAGEWISPS